MNEMTVILKIKTEDIPSIVNDLLYGLADTHGWEMEIISIKEADNE